MKTIRQVFHSIVKKVRPKPLESTDVVCEAAVSSADKPQHQPHKTLSSHHVPHYRLNSDCITIFISAHDQTSKTDTGDSDSTASTDASPSATVSSRTSVGAPSVSADQRYKVEMAALGLAMKLPLKELSLIASDSNFFLGTGEAIKEADFCSPKASDESMAGETPQENWSNKFDIFEEKRGPGDAVLMKAAPSAFSPDNVLTNVVPIGTAKIGTALPQAASVDFAKSDIKAHPATDTTKVRPGHPAFLTHAEFAALPLYEEIEDDPTYDIPYTRTHDFFASMASLSSFLSTDHNDNSWFGKIKTGIDIGGDLHFLEKGVKRKASVKATGTPIIKQVSEDAEDREFSPKRRDCRIREKRVWDRFSDLYGRGIEWYNQYQYTQAVYDDESGDEDVIIGLKEFLAGQRRNERSYDTWDDGYGGYSHEIF